MANDGNNLKFFGRNTDGELAHDSRIHQGSPVTVALAGVQAMGGGDHHSIVMADNSAFAWGDGNAVGTGSNLIHFSPSPVCDSNQTAPCTRFLTELQVIAGGRSHNLALKTEGTVWSWGSNTYGQLGIGNKSSKNIPVQVYDQGQVDPCENVLSGIKFVAASAYRSVALKNDGTLWMWGDIRNRHLLPVQLDGISNVEKMAAGGEVILALKNDGSLWSLKQTGTTWSPERICKSGNNETCENFNDIVSFASGQNTHFVVEQSGSVWAWGYAVWGQLGNGARSGTTAISKVNIENVIDIDAGREHTIALKSDGSVWTWGGNSFGQLGIGGEPMGISAARVTGF